MKPRVHVFMDPDADPFDIPEEAITVRDVEDHMADFLGGRWDGWHRGVAVPNLGLWTQVDVSDKRWRITGLLLLGDGIRAEDLRKVPIAAIENSVNLGVDRAEGVAREELANLPPLVRTSDTAPEEWSRLVAAHYRVWAQAVPHPGASMAAEWGVNRQTVAAWIREARLRGLLPPARATKPSAKKATKKPDAKPVKRTPRMPG